MGKLCLTRKKAESVSLVTSPGLGETIQVIVKRVVGNKVELQFIADDTVQIMRTEIIARTPNGGAA